MDDQATRDQIRASIEADLAKSTTPREALANAHAIRERLKSNPPSEEKSKAGLEHPANQNNQTQPITSRKPHE